VAAINYFSRSTCAPFFPIGFPEESYFLLKNKEPLIDSFFAANSLTVLCKSANYWLNAVFLEIAVDAAFDPYEEIKSGEL